MLVKSWRKNFGNTKLPFISIQLPSYKEKLWPDMRYAQYRCADENSYCYIVPTFDLGNNNDIHYKGKKDVGKRAAYIALNNVYDMEVCEFPVYKDFKFKDNVMTISFKNASSEIIEACLNDKNELVFMVKDDVQSLRYAWSPSMLQSALLLNDNNIPVYPFEVIF